MKKLLLLLLFTAAAYAQPNITQPADMIMCDVDGPDGMAVFDLTMAEPQILGILNANQYNITFHETAQNAEFGVNQIPSPNAYYNIIQYQQTVFIRVTEIANEENYATTTINLIVNPAPVANEVDAVVFDTDGIEDESTVIDLTYYESAITGETTTGMYNVNYYASQEDFENGIQIENPTAYYTGSQTIFITVQDYVTGCVDMADFNIIILPEDYETPAPDGETIYAYTAGETLADIPVEGENIQWYETETGDTPLPSNTVLSHNTTYYAAQTVYNIESSDRLAVTALDNLMSTDSQEFAAISHYPNPVKDILNITNGNEMQSAIVSNMLGQEVMSKDINSSNTTIDLSGLGKGVYLIKLSSGGKTKTLKIIKE